MMNDDSRQTAAAAIPALGECCYSAAMPATDQTPASSGLPPASLTARAVAAGNGWSVCEFTCTAGPDDRAFEERHADVAISALLAGSFRYRTDSGSALLHPGSLLLGNPNACFECGHDHSRGDHCLAVHFTPGLFAEIAASRTGRSGWRFTHAMLPALPGLTRRSAPCRHWHHPPPAVPTAPTATPASSRPPCIWLKRC